MHSHTSVQIDSTDQNIIISLFRSSWPISIDTLCSLSSNSPMKVLNVLEELKRKKLIYHKKGFPKHAYFVNGPELAVYLKKSIMDANKFRTVLLKIIDFCKQSFADGEEKTLLLANLYRMIDDSGTGLLHINKAAEILLASGKKDAAISHYDYLLDCLKRGLAVNKTNVPYFVGAILGKASVIKYDISFIERASLLANARDIAKRYRLWEHYAQATLFLGEVYMRTAEHDKTLQCIRDFHATSKHVSNQNLHRLCTYLTCEVLLVYGRISEMIYHYDKIVGDLERFGDDEIALRAIANVGMCSVLNGRFARGMGLIDAVRAKANILGHSQLAAFTEILAAFCLLEVRKPVEAKSRLDRISVFPDGVLTPFGLRALARFKAFIHLSKKEYAQADACLKKHIEYSLEIGWDYVKSPWIFELLDALERRGFFHEEMNCGGEIERMINGRDLYMKGAAHRYRALRNLERQAPLRNIMNDLKQSEKFLEKAGAEIELARTRIDLGRIYLQKKDSKQALSYLTSAWAILSRVDNTLFPEDLLGTMPRGHKIEFMIDRIIRINKTLATAKDLSTFLEQMINAAIDLSMATRGAFFSVEGGGKPMLIVSRNLDPLSYEKGQADLIQEVVARTASEGTEVIMPEQPGRMSLWEKILWKAGIMSQACIPVQLEQYIYGYLYLDNHLNNEPFSRDELAYLRLVCNQIAIGISNVKERDDIKNLKDHYEEEAAFYKKEMGVIAPIDTVVGVSSGIKRVVNQIRQVAPTISTVLITGETGTGKEIAAKAVHNLSERRSGPFISVNIAAFPADLVASELFGHEKGAFTGANEQYRGRFELANGGTLFLDEIGDLPLAIQVKLLRVLEEGTFERLGSSKQIRSNFRIVAASNKDLSDEIKKGAFREDLYYRLNVFPIYIPPLRERKDDILPLAYHFINKFSTKKQKRTTNVSRQEMNKLLSYHWPGNVRELEHFIERALILSNGSEISFSGLEITANEAQLVEQSQLMSLEDVERSHIEKVLTMTHWRVNGSKGAASVLGLKPSTLFFRMKKLGIKRTPAN